MLILTVNLNSQPEYSTFHWQPIFVQREGHRVACSGEGRLEPRRCVPSEHTHAQTLVAGEETMSTSRNASLSNPTSWSGSWHIRKLQTTVTAVPLPLCVPSLINTNTLRYTHISSMTNLLAHLSYTNTSAHPSLTSLPAPLSGRAAATARHPKFQRIRFPRSFKKIPSSELWVACGSVGVKTPPLPSAHQIQQQIYQEFTSKSIIYTTR